MNVVMDILWLETVHEDVERIENGVGLFQVVKVCVHLAMSH